MANDTIRVQRDGSAVATGTADAAGGYDVAVTMDVLGEHAFTVTAEDTGAGLAASSPSSPRTVRVVHPAVSIDDGYPVVRSSIGAGTTVDSQPVSTSGPRTLVALIAGNHTGGALAVSTVTDTLGLTWTRRAFHGASYHRVEVWTALAPAAIASTTVRATWGASVDSERYIAVVAAPNVDASSPVGGIGLLTPDNSGLNATALNVQVTPATRRSLILALFDSGSYGATITASANATVLDRRQGTDGSGRALIRLTGVTTADQAGQPVTLGITLSSAFGTWGLGVEIKWAG